MRLDLPQAIGATGVVAVVRKPPLGMREVVEAVAQGGIRATEVTLNTPGRSRRSRNWSPTHRHRGMLIGAGTILEVEDAEAGGGGGSPADRHPGGVGRRGRWCRRRRRPGDPGRPHRHGDPRRVAGRRHRGQGVPVRHRWDHPPQDADGTAPRRPLPGLRGVTVADVADVLAAGGVGVGIGAWLTDEPDPAEITDRASQVIEAAAVVRWRLSPASVARRLPARGHDPARARGAAPRRPGPAPHGARPATPPDCRLTIRTHQARAWLRLRATPDLDQRVEHPALGDAAAGSSPVSPCA